jgi:hypothetical protein
MIRRAIGTTLAGLCALTGPLAGGAFAATVDASLTTSVTSARPGVAFTVSPTATAGGCPSASGAQTVDLTFTDSAGTVHFVGTTDTADDGSWADAPAALPVAGLDNLGTWSDLPVAPGAGTLAATCFTVEDDPGADDPDDPSDDSTDPGDDDATDPGDDSTDPGDDTDDPGDGENPITRSYPGVAFTATGTAPQLSLSASVLKPGESVTVTPGEACSATGASTVEVSLISLSDVPDDVDGEEDNPGDDTGGDGDEDGTDDPVVDDGLPSATVTSSSTGSWTPVTLALPAGLPTGDYGVTAECSTGDSVTSSYDAQPLAVGTVLISAAVCTAKSVSVNLTGSYSGEIVGKDSVLPAKLALTGDGPWKIKVRSQTTGQQLAARNVACAKPLYELGVTKTGLSSANKPQARACNTGRAPVTAVLTVLTGKKYQKVDKEALDPAECVWLQGTKLDKGEQAKAQVLIDAPGKGADDVVESFTVKRPRR